MTNVLLTGGAGFIGSHTAVELIEAGHRVIIADDLSNSEASVIDRIEQITHDHSLVEEMVRAGKLKKEQAKNHPKKNIITRAIGEIQDPEVDYFDVALNRGDIALLCSDGLTNMVEDEQIFRIVRGAQSLQDAGAKLIDAANRAGGKDNISVVLAKF